MRTRSVTIAACALGCAAGLGTVAHRALATGPGAVPTATRADVRAASLSQDGRSVVWSVTLAHGLSRAELRSGRRTVCLLVTPPRWHGRGEDVCLAATRTGLGLQRSTRAGATRTLAGTVTRTGLRTFIATFVPTAADLPYRPLRYRVQSAVRCVNGSGGGSSADCAVLFPAHHPARAELHTPRLVGCVPKGPPIVYGGPADRREIALTFDDGPWPQPPSIDFVDALHRLHVTGTFFEIGDQISVYDPTGSVERAMLADGDMIGDHTWTHPDMETLTPAQQSSQLQLTAAAIRRATGFTPCLWRPPYGAVDSGLEALARKLGYLTIDWDIDPRDWSLPGVSSIVETVLREARNGGIVEMHFGGGPRFETLQALPAIVTDLRRRGYRFVNLVQMLGLRELWR